MSQLVMNWALVGDILIKKFILLVLSEWLENKLNNGCM
jgi:hypothetical protein